jgi:hypothetical protein
MYPIVIGNYVEVLLLDSPKLLTITTNNLFMTAPFTEDLLKIILGQASHIAVEKVYETIWKYVNSQKETEIDYNKKS